MRSPFHGGRVPASFDHLPPELIELYKEEGKIIVPRTPAELRCTGRFFGTKPHVWAKLIVRAVRVGLFSL